MSRTFKHAPYWVLLNRHGLEDHDHTFTHRWHHHDSEGTYRVKIGRPILDEDGKPVFEDSPEYQSAEWIAKYAQRTKTYQVEVKWPESMLQSMRYLIANGSRIMTVSGRGVNPIWQEAQQLVNEGKGQTLLVYRTVRRVKRMQTKVYIPDYCTGSEPLTVHDRWAHDRPCGKTMPNDFFGPRYTHSWDKAGRKAERGGLRGRTKMSGRRLANAYNSGFDIEDDEYVRDDLNMTEVDPYRLW
mgnify:CR=1 FL=1